MGLDKLKNHVGSVMVFSVNAIAAVLANISCSYHFERLSSW